MTKIALLQMNARLDPQENADFIAEHAKQAQKQGAKHLFLPENAHFMGANAAESLKFACKDFQDPFLTHMQQVAQNNQLYVHIGSVKFHVGCGQKLYNRSLSYDPSGKMIAIYDKIHLFDVVLSDQEAYRESDMHQAGNQIVSHNYPDFHMGYSICYDLRFPALYQHLSQRGATVLSIPAAFTAVTGKAHWEILLRSRAIENMAYVVATAQVGVHADSRQTFGHSMVINPWGQIIAQMDGISTGLCFAEIDLDFLHACRQKIPVLSHRRTMMAANSQEM